MTDPLTEAVARIIANAMGDNFADAFKNKARWIAKRGQSGGRFRDVNEPMQDDYLSAAQAAIAAMREQLVPVGWQRRAQWPLASDPPGKINQWEQCSHDEATSHFDRRAGCEYRAIYAFPSAPTEGEG